MAVAYVTSTVGGTVFIRCLSTDTKPSPQPGWVLLEVDTGNRFVEDTGAWVIPTGADLAAHIAAGDPHTQYLTSAEGNAAYQPLASVLTNTTAAFTTAQETKLSGIATGATANSSDATLLARANHTGTQAVGTITGLGTLATQNGTFSGTSSGTNTGDQTSIVGITGTLAQFDTACTDADFLSVAAASAAYQPLDSQLTDLAALSYSSNALKVVRVNAGATAFELVTLAGGGDLLAANNLSDVVSAATSRANLGLGTGNSPEFTAVNIGAATDTTLARAAAGRVTVEGLGLVRGPASATDNAIVRFDATTGDLAQNSAATVSDDGIIRSVTNSGANPVSVPLCNWAMLTADYNLSNVATEQKAFNTTANGVLTLPTGVYEFECFLYVLAMSATSGNAAFDPIGAGTAVADRFGYDIVGIDAASPLNAGTITGSASVTQQSVASAVTAGTAVGMRMTSRGMFRVSTGGTIIPSITLVTANAATMKAGSYFMIKKVGETGETSVGAWT